MGREHDITNLPCGCVNHHTYSEACGMGPISGTSNYWTDKCAKHERKDLLEENRRLEQKIKYNNERLSIFNNNNTNGKP